MVTCLLRLLFRLVMYGQWGHWNWGLLPHSSLKCLKRFVFHEYTLPHLEHKYISETGPSCPWIIFDWTASWMFWLEEEWDGIWKRPISEKKESELVAFIRIQFYMPNTLIAAHICMTHSWTFSGIWHNKGAILF